MAFYDEQRKDAFDDFFLFLKKVFYLL